MGTRMFRAGSAGLWALAVVVAALSAGPGYCHPDHGGGSAAPAGSRYGLGGSDEPSKARAPEPYGGQKVCPVTGDKLGATGPALPVETGFGAEKPSFLGKLFGRKPTQGLIIYVCCPECAAKVKSDPGAYVVKVIAERGGSPR